MEAVVRAVIVTFGFSVMATLAVVSAVSLLDWLVHTGWPRFKKHNTWKARRAAARRAADAERWDGLPKGRGGNGG
jgi:hypothetical protein